MHLTFRGRKSGDLGIHSRSHWKLYTADTGLAGRDRAAAGQLKHVSVRKTGLPSTTRTGNLNYRIRVGHPEGSGFAQAEAAIFTRCRRLRALVCPSGSVIEDLRTLNRTTLRVGAATFVVQSTGGHATLSLDKGVASSSPDPALQDGLTARKGRASKAFLVGRALAAKTVKGEPHEAAGTVEQLREAGLTSPPLACCPCLPDRHPSSPGASAPVGASPRFGFRPPPPPPEGRPAELPKFLFAV